jgi:hypothetical protein
MPLDIGLLLPALDTEHAHSEIRVYEQVPEWISGDDLYFLDFLIFNDLFVHQRFLLVDVEHSHPALLVGYIEFLLHTVPEYRGVYALVRVSYREKLGTICRIESFEVLIERYGENEIGLHNIENLDDSDAMQV